jgi:hypothetical protein
MDESCIVKDLDASRQFEGKRESSPKESYGDDKSTRRVLAGARNSAQQVPKAAVKNAISSI